jgi:hypothetical protein
MNKSRRRQLRSAELDRQRSEDLRSGTREARHAAAVLLGRRGARAGGIRVRRLGGLARVRAARVKGGESTSPAKVAASRMNAQKARDARLAKKVRDLAWEQAVPTDYKPRQLKLDLF